ncbi:fimbria/pilus periplasmic chaperone [Vibrio mytili]|uniref:Pilus assembly protein PapD n=1 Tax=Vibrio mytili TaxID=50718 RepID=A0A0C3E7C5_9VIBR|nr:fimbria/pilus periplasmic chaperone [Vibrio mytili]KIN10288.1 pilus assembly protein PapD [Vibrio mytili]
MIKVITYLLLCVTTTLFSSLAPAYEVSPIYLELDDIGKKAQGLYVITNVEESPIMLEVNTYRADYSSGEEVLTPADDEFLILPPQAKIDGLKSQTFRVRHIPKNKTSKTHTYRIIFTQVELENSGKKDDQDSSISMLLEFATLAFVSPQASKPVAKASLTQNGLIVSNEGNRVLNMTTLEFEFSGGKEDKSISWETLSKQTSAYLMPGSRVSYALPESLGTPKQVKISNLE